MKKLSVILVVLIAALIFTSCSSDAKSSPANANYREHQDVTQTEIEFDADSVLRFDIPEAGLENLFIRDVVSSCELDQDTYGTVYLLADDRYGGNMGTSDHYLAIESNGKMILNDLSEFEGQASHTGNIFVCDFDGDGDEEIAVQETIGMTGGAGQYLSRVFDFKDGKIVEMFISYIGEELNKYFDTGFSANVLKDKKLKIENKFTQYCETIDLSFKEEEYLDFLYNEAGEPREDIDMMVDSFYKFTPVDIDDDGVCEIKCWQYTSLVGHADAIGTAKTVLKFNTKTEKFEVVDATFEMYETTVQ